MDNTKPNFNIKPTTPVSSLDTSNLPTGLFDIEDVAKVTGMSPYFIKKVVGSHRYLSSEMVVKLLDQDSFSETFVPRSKVLQYLERSIEVKKVSHFPIQSGLHLGDSKDLINLIPDNYVQCVVTSTPYWAMRVYDEMTPTEWADGEVCPFGLEQTPEGFIRHSIEILDALYPKLSETGSIWWNIMDTYNTRTQIRSNAAEALRAMQGLDERSWSDHSYKRYSAGHSYLKDGEQCLIPQRIAERASRIGYYVKSIICWGKSSSLPEPQKSRVSRNIEFIVHLTKTRTPFFDKDQFLTLDAKLGGRQPLESEKLSDLWYLPTSSGRDGHGAQFPLELPCRCISLSTKPGDIVLDPFIGSGTTAQAAALLDRKYIGFDVSQSYLNLAKKRINQSIGFLTGDNHFTP